MGEIGDGYREVHLLSCAPNKNLQTFLEKFDHYLSKRFLSTSLSFGDSIYIHIRPLEIVLFIINALFIFLKSFPLYVCFILDNLYWHDLRSLIFFLAISNSPLILSRAFLFRHYSLHL